MIRKTWGVKNSLDGREKQWTDRKIEKEVYFKMQFKERTEGINNLDSGKESGKQLSIN